MAQGVVIVQVMKRSVTCHAHCAQKSLSVSRDGDCETPQGAPRLLDPRLRPPRPGPFPALLLSAVWRTVPCTFSASPIECHCEDIVVLRTPWPSSLLRRCSLYRQYLSQPASSPLPPSSSRYSTTSYNGPTTGRSLHHIWFSSLDRVYSILGLSSHPHS